MVQTGLEIILDSLPPKIKRKRNAGKMKLKSSARNSSGFLLTSNKNWLKNQYCFI
jgi:hypothetical protein